MTTIETPDVPADHPEAVVIPSLPSENAPSSPRSIDNTDPIEDPNVAALHGMFPDFDPHILQTILESVSGDQDKAIDVLLGMSDPSYKPTVRPDATQTQLDEEFARHLMLEEQSNQRTPWRPEYDTPRAAQTQTQSSTNDGVAQFQEQLGKFAESSKRTLGTIFSKVKAKIQELDNPATEPVRSAASQRPSASPPQPSYQPYQVTPSPAVPSRSEPQLFETAPQATLNDDPLPRPPSTPINPSSIGLLPKRPVTLDSSPQPSSAGPVDDDELEYVTNPFEEERK